MHRVLIIEDNIDIRGTLEIILRKHGFEVRTLSKGEETFPNVENFQPHIIVFYSSLIFTAFHLSIVKVLLNTKPGKTLFVLKHSFIYQQKNVIK